MSTSLTGATTCPQLPTLSAEVKSILDEPPTWLVRQGSGLLLLCIGVALSLASLAHYPRTVKGRVTLGVSSQPLVIRLPAGTTAHVLRVQPGQAVQAGQLLAIVQRGPVEQALVAPLAGIIAAVEGEGQLLCLRPAPGAGQSTFNVAAHDAQLLRPGQPVLVDLNAFPSEHYGQLIGEVGPALPAAEVGRVSFVLKLKDGYRGTHGTIVPVVGPATGQVRITIADKSMLDTWLRRH